MNSEGIAAKVHLQVISVGVKLLLVHCELGPQSCPPIQFLKAVCKWKHGQPLPGTRWPGVLWGHADEGGECFPGQSFLQLLTHLVEIVSAAKLHSLLSVNRTAMYSITIQQEK